MHGEVRWAHCLHTNSSRRNSNLNFTTTFSMHWIRTKQDLFFLYLSLLTISFSFTFALRRGMFHLASSRSPAYITYICTSECTNLRTPRLQGHFKRFGYPGVKDAPQVRSLSKLFHSCTPNCRQHHTRYFFSLKNHGFSRLSATQHTGKWFSS